MDDNKTLTYIENLIQNMPSDWLNLTTHRLDIYDESRAKLEFLEQLESLFKSNSTHPEELKELPTAFDYIRLGHPLSCILEWGIAKLQQMASERVISFSSSTMPIYAVLRTNKLINKNTQICFSGELPSAFDVDLLRSIYAYQFELKKVNAVSDITEFDGSTIFLSAHDTISKSEASPFVDFHINTYKQLGSIVLINGDQNASYVSDIQHVRRRETIAMTPANSLIALKSLAQSRPFEADHFDIESDKISVLNSVKDITRSNTKALVASSGLSIQYAIMMGLIHDAKEKHPEKKIYVVVPPNCYGGTNDQARRIAASIENVEVMDLPVDGDHNMVGSVNQVLNTIANEDGIAYIIAEIPTNPRVEVPDLVELKNVLSQQRQTKEGTTAIDPVFILDQTFCPNVHFLGDDGILSSVRTISYVSGSKFPSGGLCTAGYCVGNDLAAGLMGKIEQHLILCDNEATALQMQLLAKQLPSMNDRIQGAYDNTREFVNFIMDTLPDAKINFVSEELAEQGFTPSVFSLDLPTKGNTDEEREAYKRALNLKLINLMITEIPNESKYCVSYGQLKGCYWTIPATSTQGTTKEGDKDYIARVALSANMDLELHKEVFARFVQEI